ncbi:MAG: polymer-forming cytoskeletal protein [Hyphomicrobiaceae bacterium]
MFTRRETTSARASLADFKPLERREEASPGATPPVPPLRPIDGAATGSARPASPFETAPSSVSSFAAGSIIGNDLTIMGQGLRIITRGRLQVDGRVEGDVVGQEVVVGARGHVEGVVSGETVIVQGSVHGTIKGVSVTLQSTARVEGDVHHHNLAVEQGAHLDGRVRRPADIADLRPDLGDVPRDH